MSDKFRNTFKIPVTFSSGELPNAGKLSAIASQAKSGLGLIESAIGDIWNQSGDLLLNNTSMLTNALMIPNIGRMIGQNKLINPRVPYLPLIDEYYHKFTEVGEYTASLVFLPDLGCLLWDWSFDDGATWTSIPPETTAGAVQSGTQWYVDRIRGIVHTAFPLTATTILKYQPFIFGDFIFQTDFNVIPDPYTDSSYGFQSVKIEYVNGTDNAQGYYISLPPRGPVSVDRGFGILQDGIQTPVHTLNFSLTPNSGNKTFYQSDTVDASTVLPWRTHYRYQLPDFITDEWIAAGAITDGVFYLWDPTGTGTILEGVTFVADTPTKKYRIIASGTALDAYLASLTGQTKYPTVNLTSSAEDASMYPAGGLYLITTGISLTQAISRIQERLVLHTHAGSESPGGRVDHNALLNNFSPDDVSGSLFNSSTLENDHHPQYLHRKGLTASLRDKYKNSMLGTFLMGSTDSANNHDNLTASSFGIQFGSSSVGQVLRYNPSMGDTGSLSITGGDCALETSTARYHQGSQGHWIVAQLNPIFCLRSGLGPWWGPNYDLTLEPSFISLALGSFFLEVKNWPEGMALTQIEIDMQPVGVTDIRIYPYRWAWQSGTAVPKLPQSFTGYQSGVGGSPNYITGLAGMGRQRGVYLVDTINAVASTNDWTHQNHELKFFCYSSTPGDLIYGIRLLPNYTSVAPYTP